MPPSDERQGERIAKLLARAGVASRREVERMIADGRITLGEEVITTPATVLPNLKGVSVDGKPVKAAEAARLFAFHKPSGLITAERDPAGRPTIYTALRNALPPGTPRLMPVGRLDFNTEGLLLLTNDGELKRAMELPSSGIPRTYRARTFGTITQARLDELIEGVEIEGIRYGKIDANMERSTGRNQWIELTLTEGKNREVRRVLEHLGLEVSRLLRTSYGPFELLDLPRGAAVEIRQLDVERFVKGLKAGSVDLDFKPKSIPPAATSLPVKAVPERTTAPRQPSRTGGGGKRDAVDGTGADKGRRAARGAPGAAPRQGPEKPRRKRENRDRGEEYVDRPSARRATPPGAKPAAAKPAGVKPTGAKPAGWAKARPRGKPGPRK